MGKACLGLASVATRLQDITLNIEPTLYVLLLLMETGGACRMRVMAFFTSFIMTTRVHSYFCNPTSKRSWEKYFDCAEISSKRFEGLFSHKNIFKATT